MANITPEQFEELMNSTPDGIRFIAKVEMAGPDECWLWKASLRLGYGRIWVGGSLLSAHRVAYERATGPIKDGLCLDHLCRIKHCVNPSHLDQVTQKENVRRGEAGMINKSKTHCFRGHSFSGNNLYVYKSSNGREQRRCRSCWSINSKNSYQAKKRAVA